MNAISWSGEVSKSRSNRDGDTFDLDRVGDMNYNRKPIKPFQEAGFGMKKVISLVLLLVLAASLGCAQAEALNNATVGSTVTFGNYEQGDGQAPIEWVVLDRRRIARCCCPNVRWTPSHFTSGR